MNRRYLRLSTLSLVVTLLLGACGQTPAAPSAGRAQADEQPAAVTTQPSPPAATTAATTGGGADSEGVTITVGTDNDAALVFVPRTVEAPANTPVKLIFNNTSTQPHNMIIYPPVAAKTKIVAAGASDTIEFITPGPGVYQFVCSSHEYMVGRLHVK